MNKLISGLVATTVAGGLLVAGAGSASAETLYRTGANKVTITPVGAPAGAQVTKAKVTVKKGKKTVARNKNSYKAKKGKYKVTSTVTYFPQVVRTFGPNDVWASCRVTGREIVSDRTSWDAAEAAEWGDAYISGQVTVRYAGTCSQDPVMIDARTMSWLPNTVWNTTWTEDESIFENWDGTSISRTDAILNDVSTKVGDAAYVGGSTMSVLPPAAVSYDPVVTTKNTRTVVVK